MKLAVNYSMTVLIKGRLANTAYELQMKYMYLVYCNFNRLHKQWSFNKLYFQIWTVGGMVLVAEMCRET
jgi:hypothetical protein